MSPGCVEEFPWAHAVDKVLVGGTKARRVENDVVFLSIHLTMCCVNKLGGGGDAVDQ
jgi:hypothetical protein